VGYDADSVKGLVRNFFVTLYKEDSPGMDSDDVLQNWFPQLSANQYAHLTKPFTTSEVQGALF